MPSFGIRTVHTKTYELEKFNISRSEAESFAVPYDGFDIWNQNKSLTAEIPRIEKRVEYIHIMFLPFFPIETHWTIRNQNGLFKVNAICEQKIKSIYPKNYGPWYAFFLPILFITGLLFYGATTVIGKKIRSYNYSNKLTSKKQELIRQLDSLTTPFYLVASKKFEHNRYTRVDSIINDSFFTTNLIHETEDLNSDYKYHQLFYIDSVKSKTIHKDSIIALIPNTPDEDSYKNENWILRRVIPMSYLENPNLDFQFHLGGLIIENLGKSLTLVDFENNSPEKDRWSVEINQILNTNEQIRLIYKPTNKPADISKLTFVFSDNENFYKYEVQVTFHITSNFRGFIGKDVEMKK